MTQNLDCERVRMTLIAALDEEGEPQSPPSHPHVSTCSSCRRWLEDMQSMYTGLADLSYQSVQVDLWPAVQGAIRDSRQGLNLSRQLGPIAVVALVWRGLQLLVDLPAPMLVPLVPALVVAVAMWLVGREFLAIETSAPELQKGEV